MPGNEYFSGVSLGLVVLDSQPLLVTMVPGVFLRDCWEFLEAT